MQLHGRTHECPSSPSSTLRWPPLSVEGPLRVLDPQPRLSRLLRQWPFAFTACRWGRQLRRESFSEPQPWTTMRCVPKPFSTKPTMPLFPIPPELRACFPQHAPRLSPQSLPTRLYRRQLLPRQSIVPLRRLTAFHPDGHQVGIAATRSFCRTVDLQVLLL